MYVHFVRDVVRVSCLIRLFEVAPYGISDIPELESIFEKPGLRDRVVFLDTQCK